MGRTMTKTATKKAAKARPLSKGAERVRAYLEKTGDNISSVCEGDGFFWSYTRTGLPVPGGYVDELRGAGLLEPFGQVIDPALPACLVLKAEAPKRSTACGAKSISTCQKSGFCIDCATGTIAQHERQGTLAVTWHGPKP